MGWDIPWYHPGDFDAIGRRRVHGTNAFLRAATDLPQYFIKPLDEGVGEPGATSTHALGAEDWRIAGGLSADPALPVGNLQTSTATPRLSRRVACRS